MSGQARLREIQKVYSEWCVQAAEIILAARVDGPSQQRTPLQTSASFNLKVPELFNVRNEAVARAEFFQLRTQRSFQVEIYMSNEEEDEIAEEGSGELLERWTFTFLPAAVLPDPSAQLDRHNQTLVRRLSVVLRTLLFFVRLLPAHGLCRSVHGGASAAGQPMPARYHRFRVEAWPPTSRAAPTLELVSQDFVTLPSTCGSLRLSVSQRKDLKCLSSAGPLKGVAAISSQVDKIDMEEGFFSQGSAIATSSGGGEAARGKLDKIAEEPEARSGYAGYAAELPAAGGSGEGAKPQSIAITPEPAAGPDRTPESPARSMTSSRAPSTEKAVVLQPTPPMAAAGAALPGSSNSSSRQITPLPTPCSTPNQEPSAEPFHASAAPTASTDKSAVTSQTCSGDERTAPGSSQGLEDLSNIWMSNLPDWGRRRSLSIDGSRGTGCGTSRSVSPEDPSRAPSVGELQSSGRMARGSGSISSGTGRPYIESEGDIGEICLYGMSDDEEEKIRSDEDDLDRNVVASAIMEGGGGGAFAASSSRFDPSQLGLADFEEGQVGISRRTSENQGSPRQRFSPLIAQLNPFQGPPSFDLPPVQPPAGSDAPGPGEEDATGSGSAAQEAGVGLLVEQMGDLVCRLQQRQELSIFSEETYPEELFRRLDHFRDVASGLAAN